MPNVKSPLAALSAQLDGLMLRDRQRLQRRLHGAKALFNKAQDDPKVVEGITQEIENAIAQSLQKVSAREASRPKISYPDNLPVSQKKDELAGQKLVARAGAGEYVRGINGQWLQK